MSDAGRKVDVEDVLSSIRRLVSEEARNKPAGSDALSGPEAPKAPSPDAAAAAEDASRSLPPLLNTGPDLQAAVERVTKAATGIGLAPSAEDAESESAEAEIETDSTEPTLDEAPQEPPLTAPDKLVLTQSLQVNANPPAGSERRKPLVADPDHRIEQRIEDVEALVAGEDDVDEDETLALEEEAQAEWPDAVIAAFDASNDSDEHEFLEVESEIEFDEAPAPLSADEPLQSQRNAQSPEDVAQQFDTAEDADDAPLQSARRHTGAEPLITPAAEPDIADEEDFTFADDSEEFLDEETLREMVAKMVRSELQGELGDRITRNVRKMVRREIQRALSARELD